MVATIKVQLLEINRVKISPKSIANQGNICSVGIPNFIKNTYNVVIKPVKSTIFDTDGYCDYEIFNNINFVMSQDIKNEKPIGNQKFKFKFINNSDEIANIINAVEGMVPAPVVDNNDEIANIINAVEGIVPVVNSEEIANIINAVDIKVVATIKVQLLKIGKVDITPETIANQGDICSVEIPAYFDKHYEFVIRPAKSKIFDKNGQCDYEIFYNINRDLSKIFDENGQCDYEKFDNIDSELSHAIANEKILFNKFFTIKFIKNSLKRVPKQVVNNDEIANIINAVEVGPPVPAAPVVNNDEIANIINVVEGIVPVVDNNDEIANIINVVEGSPLDKSDEIANIINAVEQYILGPLGSPPATTPLDKSDEIANIINAVEGISTPGPPSPVSSSDELINIINALESHIQIQLKIGKFIEIIKKIEEIEKIKPDDSKIIEIIIEIISGNKKNIDKTMINTLFKGVSFLSYAYIFENYKMVFYLLDQGADINIGEPSFLKILEFYANITKKQPSYKGPIDKQTQKKIDQLQIENDLLKKRINQLIEEKYKEKDPAKIQELNKTIDGLNKTIKQKDDEINKLKKNARQAATQGTTQDETTKIESKICPNDPNIVKLGTINDKSEICYDIQNQQFV